jgi:hypothetical protein
MTVKNFKISTGLDLEGLVLTNGNGELLVNGNAIAVDLTGYATESYVANALTSYATDNDVANVLTGYATEAHVANALTGYVTETGTQTLSNKTIANTLTFTGAGDMTINSDSHIVLTPAEGSSVKWGANVIATEAYVDNAISNVTVDLSTAAGTGIDWNGLTLQFDIANTIATTAYVGNAIANLIDSAPETLDTLNELAAALQDNPNVIASLQNVASGKQNTLIEGLGIDITGNTISTNNAEIANAIAGPGITFDALTGTLQAAPAFIESVDSSFVVTSGELSLSDAISIGSVELTDSVANVTAASDVFGNGSTATYAMGSAVTIGTLPAGTDVADVFVTLNTGTNSRTSKLTYVNTGGDAPTWTEYGIINSGSFPATTISFDSSGNILANVDGAPGTYSAKGIVTVLK